MKRRSITLIVLFLILTGASFITIKSVIKPLVTENDQLKVTNLQLVIENKHLVSDNKNLVADNKTLFQKNYQLKLSLNEFRKQKEFKKEIKKISQMSWMPYNIFSHSSKQYALQLKAYTDINGLRKVGNYYCVALGSYYTDTIGEKFIMTMSTGKRIKLIIADQKSDKHTNSTGRYTKSDGSEIEFIVDSHRLNKKVSIMGNVAMLKTFRGDIISIVKEK